MTPAAKSPAPWLIYKTAATFKSSSNISFCSIMTSHVSWAWTRRWRWIWACHGRLRTRSWCSRCRWRTCSGGRAPASSRTRWTPPPGTPCPRWCTSSALFRSRGFCESCFGALFAFWRVYSAVSALLVG